MSPEINQPAPDFTLKVAMDKTVSLQDYRGKKLILFFIPKMIRQVVLLSLALFGIRMRKFALWAATY